MVEIKISDEIKEVCPKITLGCIQAMVKVEKSCDDLLQKLNSYSEEILDKMVIEDIAKLPRIKDAREVYKKLGKAPSKYRVSSEALMRRILRKKGLYEINNIVEINNLISLKSEFSVGSYDLSNIKGNICLSVAKEGETYKGIGKDFLNISKLPVLCDELGTFGSPTSDSQRAMITDDAKDILICIYSFSGDKKTVEEYLQSTKHLLEEYAQGKNIETKIII